MLRLTIFLIYWAPIHIDQRLRIITSERNIYYEIFKLKYLSPINSNLRNGHSSVRMATWNLDKFSREKSSNLGIREVICRTILEQKFSIVCVQECIEPSALHEICDELNMPTLRRISEWKDNNRKWKCFTNATPIEANLNGLGFIYDSHVCDVIRTECFDIPLENCVADDTVK